MYKIILNNVELTIPEDLFTYLVNNLKAKQIGHIDISSDTILLPDWCSIRYINSLLKLIYDLINDYINSIVLENYPEKKEVFAFFWDNNISYGLYAYNLYKDHKEDLNAHLELLKLLKEYTTFINLEIGKGR